MTVIEFLAILKNKWYIVLIIAAISAICTAGYCWTMMDDQYTASVDLYILSKTGNADEQQLTQSDMNASQQLANDIAVLASSSKVKKQTADALEMDSLKGYTVNVKSASTNRVVTLSVTGNQPETAALIANELSTQLNDTASEVMELRAVNIIDPADVPDSPSGPKRLRYTGIAFVLGLAAGVLLIVAMELFNVTFRTPEEVEEALGVPVVGRMPKVKQQG